MSRSLRAEGKLPKGSKPIPEAISALKHVVDLPEVRKVVHDRPVVVRCGKPYLAVSAVCKDGLRVRIRGGGQVQHIFVKCESPMVIKDLIESAWARRRPGAFSKRS